MTTHDFALTGALAAAILSTVGALSAQKRIVETAKQNYTRATAASLRSLLFIGLGIIELLPMLTWIALLVLILRR